MYQSACEIWDVPNTIIRIVASLIKEAKIFMRFLHLLAHTAIFHGVGNSVRMRKLRASSFRAPDGMLGMLGSEDVWRCWDAYRKLSVFVCRRVLRDARRDGMFIFVTDELTHYTFNNFTRATIGIYSFHADLCRNFAKHRIVVVLTSFFLI